MQCGHDCCRHWWAVEGRYSWFSRHWDSPVTCVYCVACALPWPTALFPTQFVPHQCAQVYLKRLNPDIKGHTVNHVMRSLGDLARGYTDEQIQQEIVDLNLEVKAVIGWGKEQVEKKMLTTAARLKMKVGDRPVDTMADLKASWRDDGSNENIGKIYEVCYGDYEGKSNKQWSRTLEIEYMAENYLEYVGEEPNLRRKGGYEQCITKAKGIMVRQVVERSKNTHNVKIALSLKN